MIKKSLLIFFLIVTTFTSCKKDDYEVEYQDGYPNKLAGNWVVFEFQGGSFDGYLTDHDMVTVLDPNDKGSLIIDKMYDLSVRVRVKYDSAYEFSVEMGPQLEVINKGSDIKFVTLKGRVSDDAQLINDVYSLAYYTFDDIAFDASDIEEAIIIYAGYYDQNKHLYDTTLIMGYRKTGFENIDY